LKVVSIGGLFIKSIQQQKIAFATQAPSALAPDARAWLAGLVAFGRPYIANRNLPHSMARNLPLSSCDGSTLFGGGAKGFTDCVSLAPQSTNTF
jgi:hypothetical protein